MADIANAPANDGVGGAILEACRPYRLRPISARSSEENGPEGWAARQDLDPRDVRWVCEELGLDWSKLLGPESHGHV